ncbi:hypothetical protein GUITHDRAFT_106878 [Guillardia theta CCMP2712]|uniref:Uncharacterized protein n=1 Tax=Guillardia theta (strain CCMP2712) TaxID=905079 RepID=L1JH64_GUITC|nr:hypothetical protein GUITHDRAFT_106878 [Guillardia theta CCMP2712]EKX47435.1 hypothetical protein GUITHDRAFT_106878 [Guillardia theta CCMP2712]|eukprot:XP_005834415.1 hypothetical protein GUITHDRAFT_106878 [Guillardia theta CCMP2712]
MDSYCPRIVDLLRRVPAKKLWNGVQSPSYNFLFRDKPRSLIEVQETSQCLIGVCCLYDKSQTEIPAGLLDGAEEDSSNQDHRLDESLPVNTTGIFASPTIAELARNISPHSYPLSKLDGYFGTEKSLKGNKKSKTKKRKAKVVFGSQYREEPAPRPKSPAVNQESNTHPHRSRCWSEMGGVYLGMSVPEGYFEKLSFRILALNISNSAQLFRARCSKNIEDLVNISFSTVKNYVAPQICWSCDVTIRFDKELFGHVEIFVSNRARNGVQGLEESSPSRSGSWFRNLPSTSQSQLPSSVRSTTSSLMDELASKSSESIFIPVGIVRRKGGFDMKNAHLNYYPSPISSSSLSLRSPPAISDLFTAPVYSKQFEAVETVSSSSSHTFKYLPMHISPSRPSSVAEMFLVRRGSQILLVASSH